MYRAPPGRPRKFDYTGDRAGDRVGAAERVIFGELRVREGPVQSRPIAVFDSGLGGLSVVRHLRRLLPAEDIVYFGDTARVPYGSKSRQTVISFALDCARFLLAHEPKLLVAACNTASALAIDELEQDCPLPVLGVVRPGAAAAAARCAGGAIGVIGTEATVNSNAYPQAIAECDAKTVVVQRACPLFVPMVEEGRGDDDSMVRLAVETYLAPIRARGVSVLVLGCTHYPLIRGAIAAAMGPDVEIIDSGRETSAAARRALEATNDLSPAGEPGTLRCYVSDNPARFRQIGSRFLNHEIEHVELIEPERYIRSAAHLRED